MFFRNLEKCTCAGPPRSTSWIVLLSPQNGVLLRCHCRFYFLPPCELAAIANTPILFSATRRSGVVLHTIPDNAL